VGTLKLGLPPHLQHTVKVTWLLSAQELLAAEIHSQPHIHRLYDVLASVASTAETKEKTEPETDSHSRLSI